MKQCPKCKNTYTDETLKYCLVDGTILTHPKEPPRTLRMPSPDVTELQRKPYTLSERRSQHTERRKSRAVYVGLLSVLFVVGVGILAFFAWTKIQSGRGSKSSASNSTTSSQGQATDPANPERESLYTDEYADDFSGSLKNNWHVVSGDWYTKDGVLEGVSNRKDSVGGPVWAALTLNRDLPADCSVSFRTRIVDGELSELALHVSNNRYVRVYLYTINKAVVLGDGTLLRDMNRGLEGSSKQVGGGGSMAYHEFPVTNGTWYNVQVTAKGNTYTINVGGQMVVKYVDATNLLNKEGTIGLISNGHVQYDDLRILKAEP